MINNSYRFYKKLFQLLKIPKTRIEYHILSNLELGFNKLFMNKDYNYYILMNIRI